MFEFEDCSGPITIPTDGGWGSAALQDCENGCSLCSGYDDEYVQSSPCTNAIDGNPNSEWRPNGDGGDAGVNWIAVILTARVRCIKCSFLGASENYNPYQAYEYGGGQTIHSAGSYGDSSSSMWGGGLAVAVSSDGSHWTSLVKMSSPSSSGMSGYNDYASALNTFVVPPSP